MSVLCRVARKASGEHCFSVRSIVGSRSPITTESTSDKKVSQEPATKEDVQRASSITSSSFAETNPAPAQGAQRRGGHVKCPHCGFVNPDSAFLCNCGYDFQKRTVVGSGEIPGGGLPSVGQQTYAQLKEQKKKRSWWSWKIDEADLQNQVENYDTLKITESYRGISVLIVIAGLALTLVLSLSGIYGDPAATLSGIIVMIVVYLPVLFFTYKGHRWAIVLLMALWTFGKGYELYVIGQSGSHSHSSGMVFFWWLLITPYFWKALKVENERRKLAETPSQMQRQPHRYQEQSDQQSISSSSQALGSGPSVVLPPIASKKNVAEQPQSYGPSPSRQQLPFAKWQRIVIGVLIGLVALLVLDALFQFRPADSAASRPTDSPTETPSTIAPLNGPAPSPPLARRPEERLENEKQYAENMRQLEARFEAWRQEDADLARQEALKRTKKMPILPRQEALKRADELRKFEASLGIKQ
jgi:hypothetical protein